MNYIAVVRHQKGKVEAVKVFRFRDSSKSLLDRYKLFHIFISEPLRK
jgi:hypothetical protein